MSVGVLKHADRDIADLSARHGGGFATAAALKALPAASRAHDMVANIGAQLWLYDSTSSASASATVLVPDDSTGR